MQWTEFRWPPKPRRPVIDMTVEGDFVDPKAAPLSTRIMGIAILVAVVAGAIAAAALLLYLALALIPVILAAAVIAYGAFRFQLWRARRAALHNGNRDLFRP